MNGEKEKKIVHINNKQEHYIYMYLLRINVQETITMLSKSIKNKNTNKTGLMQPTYKE